MRLVFAGTPDFARQALQALLAAGHDIALVLTQPDRPAGRGLKLTPSPVKEAALDAGIEVAQPRSLRLDGRYPDEARAAQQRLRDIAPEVMVVAAYGLILPRWTLDLPARGCLNIHASLLPRWRGAAPIQRAIEAGDDRTGVTIMQMDEGLDTGDMLLERIVPIGAQTSAAVLHDELADAGAAAIVEALAQLDDLRPRKQPAEGVTYAAKLEKAEAALDFEQSAKTLERRIRAFNPVPGASLRLPGLAEPVKVWRAQALDEQTCAAPGTVVRATQQGIDLATGHGVLRLLELQKAGGKRQEVDVFVRGWQPSQAGA
ncbi:methionyl-tRNA formyltransferase [Bordetella holmesii]|uniref:Methionyl-tRNA formyltransferase n=2 Tax=Bordetella holmesii TaxID=35814 RepID=A0A158M8Y3_9BORD|nr:methionyl-tRNA formyltransferase [Bordetella holmesii]AHV94373.1 methionyl-tRNA formyltransferase [Bordetella holmesii ATCC 51541]AIT25850.1 methionyl-tRNA formyltransferase [Bordetella holmesii 44057]EWM42440.1 methionyl-tRNA formyltransferase [Bordetella holmesii 41130]EWM46418.1 methionyl-tRNA formyltransferase [Bordetella holmesii 35009]EWM50582.1 methionyl-tRNA formyltransferase [Bordetella holmesii 70147]